MNKTLKVAIYQMDMVWENPAENCRKIEEAVTTQMADAELIVLPEMFATGFSMNPAGIAQEMDGEVVTFMKELARRTDKAFIGSLAIHDCVNHSCTVTAFYNRLFFFTPDGVFLTYNKRHLFRMAKEQDFYEGGTSRLIVHYKGFRICPMVCYDLRFPVWSRNRDDYDVLVYVACWPEPRRYPWSTLLKARAIENLSYVIGVNRAGEEPGNVYSGDSVVIDYTGHPMVEAEPYVENIRTVTLEMDPLLEFRRKFPAFMDADDYSIRID